MDSKVNPYSFAFTSLANGDGGSYGSYYSLPALEDERIDKLPYAVLVLLESAIRNCDGSQITKDDVEKIMDWEKTSDEQVEIPFKPARVILQDFTGVPVLVDFASMRDAMSRLGDDPDKINPMVPADLVIDHSVTADVVRSESAVQANMELEFERNKERFACLKWGSSAFHNMLIIPPASGIVHQVNLEYLGRVVFNTNGVVYPDSVVGTDSHTTMINGLGILGWGVGGIDAEAAMLGQPMSMVLPGVVGFKLYGTLRNGVTATDLVLTVTQMLRKHGVVGKFVEFYGRGLAELALADRATIANMAPEYGATAGFFPVDHISLEYLKMTGRNDETPPSPGGAFALPMGFLPAGGAVSLLQPDSFPSVSGGALHHPPPLALLTPRGPGRRRSGGSAHAEARMARRTGGSALGRGVRGAVRASGRRSEAAATRAAATAAGEARRERTRSGGGPGPAGSWRSGVGAQEAAR
ncbi:hypothetical protein C2845_PM10G09860 [Panicum miliaceum]|uniref:aconitate hydratase n=1 Tax=Panicum miliaceum TaxID=4540 RepID=A0A3L6PJI8_PANMI|nr:hypothetical protein C2845_PM10G09860 [Panicum miliaceum]